MTGKIIWLASYPKSGNTWLRAFIGALIGHEVINSAGALAEFSMQCNARQTVQAVFGGNMPVLDSSHRWRLLFQERLSGMANGPAFVKTHCRYRLADGTPLFSPQAANRAFLIVRNPIDVCASLTNHFGVGARVAIDMLNNASAEMARGSDRSIATPLGDWTSFNESWLSQREIPLAIIRYEDLFDDGERIFAGIARDLFGIDDTTRVTAAMEQAQFGELQAREQQYGFNEKPQRAERFFWKGRPFHGLELFSEQEQRLIWARHAELAERLGYRFENGRISTVPFDRV